MLNANNTTKILRNVNRATQDIKLMEIQAHASSQLFNQLEMLTVLNGKKAFA